MGIGKMKRVFSLSTSLQCSLRCTYCASGFNIPTQIQRKTIFDYMGIEDYVGELRKLPIPDDAIINFHGPAEPLLGPLSEIVEGLKTDRRELRIYTNLLQPARLFELVEKDEHPESIEVAASYHVASYRRGQRGKVRLAIERILRTGASVRLMVPATPGALIDAKLEEDFANFERKAIGKFRVSIIALGNNIDGRPYPASYTESELVRLSLMSCMWGTWQKLPADIKLLRKCGGPLRLQGQPCWYPMVHAAVGIDGRIWNCGPNHERTRRLGDPIEELYPAGPVACPHPVCTCKPRGVEYSLEARGISLEKYLGLLPEGVAETLDG